MEIDNFEQFKKFHVIVCALLVAQVVYRTRWNELEKSGTEVDRIYWIENAPMHGREFCREVNEAKAPIFRKLKEFTPEERISNVNFIGKQLKELINSDDNSILELVNKVVNKYELPFDAVMNSIKLDIDNSCQLILNWKF